MSPNEHNHDHNHQAKFCPDTYHMNQNCQDHPAQEDADQIRRQHVLKRLKIAAFICSAFFTVEVTGGILAGSLAVLSDAAHLFADLASFAVAIAASHLANLPATRHHTFGFKRAEALAALFSVVCLALVSFYLAIVAIIRLLKDWAGDDGAETVDGKLMSMIASIGVVVNIILAFVLGENHVHLPGQDHGHDHSHGHSHDEHDTPDLEVHHEGSELLPSTVDAAKTEERNINLHAAYLHVLGDLLMSVAVLIAGLIIWYEPKYHAADPICTILFCILVAKSTVGVIKSSISVLLEEVPPDLDWVTVQNAISKVDGVVNVHDLHIWSISHGVPALSVHVSAPNVKNETVLKEISHICVQKFGISHSTIQIQDSVDCITCDEEMKNCY